ncbi:hypothetical protein, partial [Enterococcus faecalis]|uniref:hypothetical protein n=1 Tax=Enterococcus faecalis TaxID=1351 RepID=UPI003984F23D
PIDPIGIDSDSEAGGSRDYSCVKMKKQHPSIACIDDDEYTRYVKGVLLDAEFEYKKLAAMDKEHPDHSKYKDDKFIAVCKDLDNVKRILGA